jgi:Mg2+ and Co2+ transporter CorA
LSTGVSDLFERISKKKELPLEKSLFAARILYSILQEKINDYGEIVQDVERRTIDLEDVPVNRTSPMFLESTFHLKKEIQKTISNLWHFNQVLKNIKLNKVALKGMNDDDKPFFSILDEESEYMYETAQNIRESLISLIELHINTVSYDMNKVMKVIAVITCLGLIPTIIGGLLGVNLMDNPYHITINEVFFIVFSLMVLGMYIFFKKGWL